MANLKSIAELEWRRIFPRGKTETRITKGEFIATAKTEYAYQFWVKWKQTKREEGEVEVPSYLLTEVELDVVNDKMDISCLDIMRELDFDQWLQNVGGIGCKCRYIKSSLNNSQLLCGDDSLPDDARTYFAVGKTILFPRGVHKAKLSIIYANNGQNVDDKIEVDDVAAALVRRALGEIYGKPYPEDKTNDAANGSR